MTTYFKLIDYFKDEGVRYSGILKWLHYFSIESYTIFLPSHAQNNVKPQKRKKNKKARMLILTVQTEISFVFSPGKLFETAMCIDPQVIILCN